MKNIKNILQSNGLVKLSALVLLAFSINTFSMIQSQKQREMGRAAVRGMKRRQEYLSPEYLRSASLEQLVVLFNEESALKFGREVEIFERIDAIVKNILWAVVCQYQIDHGMQMTCPLAGSYSSVKYKNAQDSSFRDYKGEMIPIRPGSSVIHIPNYKVLKNLDEAVTHQESLSLLPEKVINELTILLGDNIKFLYDTHSRVAFLTICLKALQDSYDALSWRKRWLQMPW